MAAPKTERIEQAQRLEDMPNIGPASAADLRLLGVAKPADLVGRDAFALYDELCARTEARHDPCVIDVFMSAVHYAETGEARKWWDFTAERKRRLGKG